MDVVLSGDFLTVLLSSCELSTVHCAGLVSSAWHEVAESSTVWMEMCRRRWATKVSKYHLTPHRKRHLSLGSSVLSWKEQYRLHEEDGKRSCISAEELTSLTFDFNFRMMAHTRASQNFRFCSDGHVSGHPNGLTYEWRLLAAGNEVALGEFPVAQVQRRTDWGWVVSNPNVVCCSLDDDGDWEMRGSSAAALHPEFFESNPDPMIAVDVGGAIHYVSQRIFRDLLERHRQRLVEELENERSTSQTDSTSE